MMLDRQTDKWCSKFWNYHLHHCDCRFEWSNVGLSGFEERQEVVEIHNDMNIQIEDHNEELHFTGTDFNCEPQQPIHADMMIDVQKRDLILFLAQHKAQCFEYLNAAHKQQEHANLHFLPPIVIYLHLAGNALPGVPKWKT